MSHVPTVLKSDRSVFDKMLPVDDNDTLDSKNCSLLEKILPFYNKSVWQLFDNKAHIINDTVKDTGFIQAGRSKIQGLFKDF